MLRSIAATLPQLLLIFLFTYSAVSKLADTKDFELTVRQVPLLNNGAAIVVILIPLVELIIVLLLLFQRTLLYGLYASIALLTIFTIYLLYMMMFLPKMPCSCGGVIDDLGWKEHVVFNVGFIGISVWGMVRERKRFIS